MFWERKQQFPGPGVGTVLGGGQSGRKPVLLEHLRGRRDWEGVKVGREEARSEQACGLVEDFGFLFCFE